MKKIKIGDRWVGEDEPTFIIAEAGSNHDGKLEQAKKLIDIAAEADADAVKFQTFFAEKIVAKKSKKAEYMEMISKEGESTYDILKKLELPREWHNELARHARKKGIMFLSSAFDKEAVDLLINIGVPALKVASGELTNFPLLRYMAKKGKPMILSTGMATLAEVGEAINVIEEENNNEIVLLHCVGAYPTPLEDVNLKVIHTMKEAFHIPVGYSDHTLGIAIPIAAAALGATVIEKHFTLNKNLKGPDHFYALNPGELEAMIKGIREVEKAFGDGVKTPRNSEIEVRKLARRSIYANTEIPKGTIITKDMLLVVRPEKGLQPKYLNIVVGKKAKVDIKRYDEITWDKI